MWYSKRDLESTPWCKKCDMCISRGAMAEGHLGTVMRKRGVEQKRHPLAATTARVAVRAEFRARYQMIEKLDTFK